MESLAAIIDQLVKRIDYLLNNPPRTSRVGNDEVTTFDGKEYKNLTNCQVYDLSSDAYWGAYRLWEEARRYNNYLECHFTPTADYYLREMRKNLTNKK